MDKAKVPVIEPPTQKQFDDLHEICERQMILIDHFEQDNLRLRSLVAEASKIPEGVRASMAG